ncbi:acyl-CoA dehydrogenase [Thermodesulfobacteriota bacterium]
MPEKFVSKRNLKFLLYEVFDAESLTKIPYFKEDNRVTYDMILDSALEIGENLLRPHLQEMDQKQPEFIDGQVKVYPEVKNIMKEFGEGGWISSGASFEVGGGQLPKVIRSAAEFIFQAANYSAPVYPGLTSGAADLIETFGSKDQIDTYLPRMFAGEWQGTMALTEPQAGSSLSDITVEAIPTDEDHYRIHGQKVFISNGDHDCAENIIHLLLAKIKGGPAGVKGISLFIVPKLRIGEEGKLISNDVNTVGIFHKLGYRGSPITHLSFGDKQNCRGYLVGEPHRGLSCMFQLMNSARITVGIGATGISSAAYYASLDYAIKREQGRKPENKDPESPQVPIVEHADVKRMLLFQRAVVDGSLSLLLQCSMYDDLARGSEGDQKERYDLLLDILTPVAKTFPSEMGVVAVSQALQILGGSGFCTDYPLEQFYRDQRINPIHEGTTGIQGIDILGRKVLIKNGKAFETLEEEINKTIRSGLEDSGLKPYALKLQDGLKKLQNVTASLTPLALKGELEKYLADATLYLELFGIITIGWQWLLQGLAASEALKGDIPEGESDFYKGKLQTLKYFFHYELPKIEGLITRLMEADGLTVETDVSFFTD